MLEETSRSQALADAVIRFIRRGQRPDSDAAFNRLALELFDLQFHHNPIYQRFCMKRGLHPENVRCWQEIPAAPTEAFKTGKFASFPLDQAVRTFLSSGTTRADRSQHHLETLDVYEASLLPNFRQHLLPDSARLPMLSLTASPGTSAQSSLIHMIGCVMDTLGTEGSRFFVTGDGEMLSDELMDRLERSQKEQQPVMLLGAAFSFVHFFDACQKRNRSFRLPEGTRAMETGGYKGRSREVPREDFLQKFPRLLGIPLHRVVNEYGMTELSVQFYDTVLADNWQGLPPRPGKAVPHWARVRILDPETMSPAAPGKTGLIEICDLSNVGSCIRILTADLGQEIGAGFQVLGRASGADARGCSLTEDELLSSR